jgi:hypothetical protein
MRSQTLAAWERVEAALDPLAIGRGAVALRRLLRAKLPVEHRAMSPQPDLAAVCGRALAAIDGWLSDDDRALLRSRSLETTPTLYGEILRRLPHYHLKHAEAAWLPIVEALGHLRHNVDHAPHTEAKKEAWGRTVGYLLGYGGYSELRMTRLLTGRGVRLPQAIENSLDLLIRKRVGACRLGDLAVADALGDRAAYARARRRIAMDYARGVDAADRNAARPAA